jgi:hypothetical protein
MAAGATLGFLKFVLGFDTIAFKKGMTQAEKDLVGFSKKIEKFGKGMADVGAKMSLAITAPIIAFAGAGIKEAQETAVAMGKVSNALAQTGAVAGQTAPQLEKAAAAFETKSLYEADQILGDVTATMARFGKILPANFQAAQQAAVDLAAATGKDLAGAASLVGRALQDPVKGMKALKEVGITLTDAQKKQVAQWMATGDAAKAQAFVLDQINAKVKGAAAAAQETQPFNKLTDAFKSLAESLGTILLPFLIQLSNWAVSAAAAFQALDPNVQAIVVGFIAVAAAAGPLLVVVGNLIKLFSGVKVLVQFAAGLLGVATAEGTAATGATAAGIAFRAMLGPLALIVGAATAVYLAWKYWPQIVQIVKDVWNAVSTYLGPKLRAVFDALMVPIRGVVNAFKWMQDKVVGHSYVPDMVDGIAAEMKRLPKVMVEPAQRATEEVTALFDEMSKIDWIPEVGFVAAGPTEVTDKTVKGLAELGKINEDTTAKMADQWRDMANSAVGSMRSMVDAFKSGDILGGIQTLLNAVLDVLKALKGIGIIGGGAGATTASAGARGGFGGARALGGPVVPGKSYMVGENGPEFFSTKRRGFIHPSGREGQQARVMVVPSPYFDVVVDRRAASVAAPMAGQAAIVGISGSEARAYRRSRRNIYAAG